MSWPKLQARFIHWFAEAVVEGDLDLARRLAGITTRINGADEWAPTWLRLLFDEFEAAESPVRAVARTRDVDIGTLRSLVPEIEELLDDAGSASNGEGTVPYLAGHPRTRLVRQTSEITPRVAVR